MLSKNDELRSLNQLKWKLFTVHSVDDYGQCSCKNPACPSPGKHPLERNWQGNARHWPHPFPERHNVGVPCGTQCIVLDIDPRNGGIDKLNALVAEYGELPETWTVHTGGNGFHYYFKAPHEEFPSGNALKAQGVELKGHGSYVIGPASKHISGKQYEWMDGFRPEDKPLAECPQWVISVCSEKRRVQREAREYDGSVDREELMDALRSISPDISRYDWIKIGGALKTAGLSFEDWDAWSAQSPKYKKDEMEEQWASLEANRVFPETIFHLAYRQGWTPPLDETPLNFVVSRETPNPPPPGCPVGLPDNTLIKAVASAILDSAMHKHSAFAIASTLSALSGLSQGNYYTPVKHGYVGSYYILMAGASAGKEHYGNRTMDIIRRVAEHRVLRMPSSSQALRFELSDCNARILFMDEALRVLQNKVESKNQVDQQLISDILSIWGMSGEILSGYSTKREQDKTPDVRLPFLSIIGCGTTEKFDYLLRRSADFITDGILSRFDIVQSDYASDDDFDESSKFILEDWCLDTLREVDGRPEHKETFVLPKDNEKVGSKREKIFYFEPRPVVYTGTSAAEWKAIFKDYQRKARDDSENNLASSLWNRAAEKILRTSSLLAIARNPREPKITPSDIEWARGWHEWIVTNMEVRVLDKAGQSIEAEIGEILLHQLQRTAPQGQWVGLGVLRNTSRRLRNCEVKVIEKAVESLVMSGLVKVKDTRRGPASTVIALNSAQ